MEKWGSHRQKRTMRRGGKEGKERKREEKGREVGKYDKVTSCSAAARLEHIWDTSVSWKILQEIKEEEVGSGDEEKEGEKGRW